MICDASRSIKPVASSRWWMVEKGLDTSWLTVRMMKHATITLLTLFSFFKKVKARNRIAYTDWTGRK
jgi:hypothetical protein